MIYVLGAPISVPTTLASGRRLLEPGMWTVASAGAGSKGDRNHAWAWLATAC